jgi:hypothetical protein
MQTVDNFCLTSEKCCPLTDRFCPMMEKCGDGGTGKGKGGDRGQAKKAGRANPY